MLKTRTYLPFVLLLLGFVSAAGSVQAGDIKDTVKRSFKVRPGGTLFLDIDHGNVAVRSTSGDAVHIEVERSVDTDDRDDARAILDRHDLVIEQHGNNVSVESRMDQESGGFWGRIRQSAHMSVRVVVQVPSRYNVDFSTGAGNVAVDDVDGEVRGRTGAGNVAIGAVRGTLDVSSGTGNIEIEGAEGYVEANTGAGNIEARDLRGQVDLNTGAGNITAYITAQPDDDSELHTGAGNVTAYLADDVGVIVQAEASVGSASTDFPLQVEGKWMRKSFEGAVNGGGPRLELSAGVGNVTLRRM